MESNKSQDHEDKPNFDVQNIEKILVIKQSAFYDAQPGSAN